MSGDGRHPTSRWRAIREVILDAAFLAAVAVLVYAAFFRSAEPPVQARAAGSARRPEPPLPTEPLSLDGAVLRGSTAARVALIEYSDFECPFCGKFARETLPTLEAKYVRTGQVLVAFRHYPLTIHALAVKAAEAAECAGKQGKFWEMHDRLFEEPRRLDGTDLRQSAQTLGLDGRAFENCLSGEAGAKVRADMENAKALGITGTPTFFLGRVGPDGRIRVTQRLSGAQPTGIFEAALERLVTSSPATPTRQGDR